MRQLILETEPNKDNQILLSGKTYKYLCGVLRLKSGDSFDARLPKELSCNSESSCFVAGGLVVCTVQKIDSINRTILVSVIPSPKENEKSLLGGEAPISARNTIPKIILFQWLLKSQKMDQVIRQATEAGVFAIFPILGEYCVAQGNSSKDDRWQRVIKEARQQSGSAVDTKIFTPTKLSDALKAWYELSKTEKTCKICFTETLLEKKSLHDYLSCKPTITAVAIGAEGGFSPEENKLLTESGFFSYHFNTNILRAETASIYGIATVQSILSEI